jgi:hypothetical protein
MFCPPSSVFPGFSPQLDNIMNVVPRIAGPCVPGKNHAHQTFFYRDRFTDFELRFVPAARDSSMWCLLHLSNCDGPGAARTCSVET